MLDVFDLLEVAGAGPVRIGQRHKCPECEANRGLSVRNEMYARCFACEKVWNANATGAGLSWLSAALNRLFEDCQTAANGTSELAKTFLNYFMKNRGIDELVLKGAPIGMIPENYGTASVRRLAEECFFATRTQLPPNCPTKDAVRLQAVIDRERQEFDTLVTQLSPLCNCGGWIAFFYGEPGKFTSVKLRNPFKKDFKVIRPIASLTGVFNPIAPEAGCAEPLLSAYDSWNLPWRNSSSTLIAFEGEFNQLTFLSKLVCAARAAGKEEFPDPWPSCALGACNSWDINALLKLSSEPIICYDNDDAGEKARDQVIESAQDAVRCFTTPRAGTDMDEYLRMLKPGEVIPALKTAFESGSNLLRPIETVRQELNSLRCNKEKHDFSTEVEPDVIKQFWRYICARGRVLNDASGTVYFFDDNEKAVYEIGTNAYWFSFMSRFNLLSEQKISRQVSESTKQRGLVEGKRVTVYRTSHYDAETHTVFVYLGNHCMARIDADRIETVRNGNDGVFFMHPRMQPFNLKTDGQQDVAEPTRLGLRCSDTLLARSFDAKFAAKEGYLTPPQCQQMIVARLITMLLGDMCESKPIMVLKGERGSGKTLLASKVGWLFEGENFWPTGASSDPRELETKLVAMDTLVLDNVDDLSTRENGSLDVLCRAASNGAVTRRKLYTDATSLTLRMTAHLWVTTRTNPLDRPDLADRQILIPLERYGLDGLAEGDIRREFLANRDALMSELIWRVQKVLASLKREKGNSYQTKFRMRDFAFICLKVAHDEGWGDEMHAMLDGSAEDQNMTANEGNSLVEILRLFIGSEAKAIRAQKSLRFYAADLRAKLLPILHELRLDCPWRNAQQLSFAIKREPNLYKELGISPELDRSRKMITFVIRPSEEILEAAIMEVRNRLTEPYNMDTDPAISELD
jgi:hypothetical protein